MVLPLQQRDPHHAEQTPTTFIIEPLAESEAADDDEHHGDQPVGAPDAVLRHAPRYAYRTRLDISAPTRLRLSSVHERWPRPRPRPRNP